MLNFAATLRIHLHVAPVDMRKSFQGLTAIAKHEMKGNPVDGSLFVFCNRSRTLVKLLYFDGTGMWVLAKRLERGTYWWPSPEQAQGKDLQLRHEALSMLLGGIDLKGGSLRAWFCR
jgi:transposase